MSQHLKLTTEMQRFADEQVKAGHFRSTDEVARAAFALLRENERRRNSVRDELEGIFSEMDAGKAIPTTDDEFERMVRTKADHYRGQ